MIDRDTEYNPSDSLTPEERAYGSVSEPATKNFGAEGREAEQSETTGRVPQREVEELRAEAGNVKNVKGTRYQGKGGSDAMKQERQLDQALSEEGAI